MVSFPNYFPNEKYFEKRYIKRGWRYIEKPKMKKIYIIEKIKEKYYITKLLHSALDKDYHIKEIGIVPLEELALIPVSMNCQIRIKGKNVSPLDILLQQLKYLKGVEANAIHIGDGISYEDTPFNTHWDIPYSLFKVFESNIDKYLRQQKKR